jgi:cobaltochelatase CobS
MKGKHIMTQEQTKYKEGEIIEDVTNDLGLSDDLTENDQGYKVIIENVADLKRVLWEGLRYRPVTPENLQDKKIVEGSQVWIKRDNDGEQPRLATVANEPFNNSGEWIFDVSYTDDSGLSSRESVKLEMVDIHSNKEEFVSSINSFKVRTDDYLLANEKPKAIRGGESSPTQVFIFKPCNKDVLEMTLINVGVKTNDTFKLDDSIFKGADKYAFNVSSLYSTSYNRQALTKEHVDALVDGLKTNGSSALIKKGNVVPTVKIDSGTETAINSMLKDTGLTIGSLLNNHNTSKKMFTDMAVTQRNSREINNQLEKMVAELRNKTAGSHFLPPEVTYDPSKIQSVNIKDYPQGEIIWSDAFDVFDVPRAHKSRFNFKVPVWNWFTLDSNGDKVPAEHPLVPKKQGDYIFDLKTLPTLLWALNKNKKSWLSGHTGTGKSSLIEEICAYLNYPLIRINFDSEITRMDLIGRDTLTKDDGVTISNFAEGILPQALKQPCVLLCDEIDFIRPDIAYVMQRALEDKGLLITEDAGRLIEPHPYCRIVATANTQGQGDDFGYQGARTQSMAFLDRFTVWLDVEYLPRAQEKKLIEARVTDLDPKYLDQILDYVQEHRKAFIDGDIGQPISPRGVLTLCEAVKTFTSLYAKPEEGLQVALQSTILNKANLQDRNVLKGVIDRMFDV